MGCTLAGLDRLAACCVMLALPCRARRSAILADAADPGDHSVRRRQRHRLVPRIVFEQLSPQLGQPIVVENRTGAGGTLGTSAVAKAEPDGYTLLAHSNAHTVSPAVYSNLPTTPCADFAGITPFGSLADRADHLAVEGLQDHPGDGRRRQGQARLVQLRARSASAPAPI